MKIVYKFLLWSSNIKENKESSGKLAKKQQQQQHQKNNKEKRKLHSLYAVYKNAYYFVEQKSLSDSPLVSFKKKPCPLYSYQISIVIFCSVYVDWYNHDHVFIYIVRYCWCHDAHIIIDYHFSILHTYFNVSILVFLGQRNDHMHDIWMFDMLLVTKMISFFLKVFTRPCSI